MLVKINDKDTRTVVRALTKQVRRLNVELRKSLTWDRGLGMAANKEFSIATDAQIYVCDPHSPWQRGTNENTGVSSASTSRRAPTCLSVRKQT